MSTQAPLTNDPVNIISSKENLFVVRNFGSIRGGRTLDVTGFSKPVIEGSHIVIRSTEDDNYKPMPLNAEGTAYAALPEGNEYVGFVIASEPTKRPFVGVITNGIVNPAASVYPIDATLLAALKAALPHIEFKED